MPKNANYKGFLTEFVNTNNHTLHVLHGVLILTGCKELQPSCKNILILMKKKSLFAGQIKRAKDLEATKGNWYPWIAILNWVLLLQRCFDCSVTIKFVNNKNQETINQRMTINEGSWHWDGPSWQCWQSRLVLTGDPHLLRISLLWISLMRFFKTFQIFSQCKFLGQNISLLQFL